MTYREREDFLSALQYVRGTLGYADKDIFMGGKSLGTFVSSAVFAEQKGFPGLVLLTPVCTDAETDPRIHKNVFAENYTGLPEESRKVLLAQGNQDPLCENPHFQDFLQGKGLNFVPLVVRGDHGLGIKGPDGKYDADSGRRNLEALAKWIFTWIR